MKIEKQDKKYCLSDLSLDDLNSLLNMIKSSCLPERRYWNHIKQSIEMEIS